MTKIVLVGNSVKILKTIIKETVVPLEEIRAEVVDETEEINAIGLRQSRNLEKYFVIEFSYGHIYIRIPDGVEPLAFYDEIMEHIRPLLKYEIRKEEEE